MNPKVLFVDDEKNILSSLRRLLYRESFELHFAGSGAEGLKVLEEHEIAVIISDMRMPEMDGVAFLKEAQKMQPDAVRMVLSGYSEISSIMEAVNQGQIWRYITKPWDDNEIKLNIRNAADYHHQAKERKRLMEELKLKNKALEMLNTQLESIVEERTWQLQERSEILNLLAEDGNYDVVINKCCESISRQVGGVSAYLWVPFAEKLYQSDDKEATDELIQGLKTVIESKSPVRFETLTAMPVLKGDNVLGAVGVSVKVEPKDDGMCEPIHCFSSIIALALSQQKQLKEAPDFIGKLDDIIDAME